MQTQLANYTGHVAKIEGPARSGKTEILVQRCATLLEAGTPAENILVAVSSGFAASAFKERLVACLKSETARCAVGSLIVERPVDICLRILNDPLAQSITGHEARLLTESEYTFFIEDMKTLGQRNGRLANMLMFFFAQWSKLEDESTWVIQGEESTVLARARELLGNYQGMLRHEVPYICANLLKDEGAQLAQSFEYVLCDDYQNFSFAEQNVLCLCAKTQLMICGNTRNTTHVNTEYPSPAGFSRFERTRKGVDVFKLNTSFGLEEPLRIGEGLKLGGKAEAQANIQQPQSASANFTLWEHVPQELSAIEQHISGFLAENPSKTLNDISIIVPTKKWGRLVCASLTQAGIAHTDAGLNVRLTGDPRGAGYHDAMSAFFTLCLVADPTDTMAWRAVSGFDNAITNSDVWEHIRQHAQEAQQPMFNVFKDVAEGRYSDDLIASRQEHFACVWRQTNASIAQLQALRGKKLIGALKLDAFKEFRDALSFATSDANAQELVTLIRQQLQSPRFPTGKPAVRVVLYENMCGLEAALLIANGLVDGLMPTRAALEPTEMQDKRDAAMEADRARLYAALSKGTQRLEASASAHCDLNTAEQLKIQVYRIASVQGTRLANLHPSLFFAEAGAPSEELFNTALAPGQSQRIA